MTARPKRTPAIKSDKNTHHSLVDDLAEGLISKIDHGEFPIGTRLPSERELCARFSVSRPVVREALSKLRSFGMVQPKAGSGVFVIDRKPSNAFTMQSVSMNERRSREQVMELLIAIEVAATRIAAIRRTEEDIKKIRRALVGMEYALVNNRLGDEEDYAFHQAIVDATYNPHFQALCKHLEFGARNLIRQTRSNTKTNLTNHLNDVQCEHQAIYDAIVQQNSEAAALAAERHLRNAAARMQIYLLDGDDGPSGII